MRKEITMRWNDLGFSTTTPRVSMIEEESYCEGRKRGKAKSHIVINNRNASRSMDATINTEPLERAFQRIDDIIRGKLHEIEKT